MRYIIFALLLLIAFSGNAQLLDRSIVCNTDTLVRNERWVRQSGSDDSCCRHVEGCCYRAVDCYTAGKLGLRLEMGGGRCHYFRSGTNTWLGNHNAGVVGMGIYYSHLGIGFRYRMNTISPSRPVVFGKDTIPTSGKMNPIKMDFFLSYSFDFKYLVSIEPYLGYKRSSFYVLDKDNKDKEYYEPTFGGVTAGVTINKYIKVGRYDYLCVFVSAGLASANLKKLDAQLGGGLFEWNYGVALKCFGKHSFYKKV